jgi:hypothetical protein
VQGVPKSEASSYAQTFDLRRPLLSETEAPDNRKKRWKYRRWRTGRAVRFTLTSNTAPDVIEDYSGPLPCRLLVTQNQAGKQPAMNVNLNLVRVYLKAQQSDGSSGSFVGW